MRIAYLVPFKRPFRLKSYFFNAFSSFTIFLLTCQPPKRSFLVPKIRRWFVSRKTQRFSNSRLSNLSDTANLPLSISLQLSYFNIRIKAYYILLKTHFNILLPSASFLLYGRKMLSKCKNLGGLSRLVSPDKSVALWRKKNLIGSCLLLLFYFTFLQRQNFHWQSLQNPL